MAYLAEVRTALANMLGESTSPNPWPSERDNAIQWSLERIARLYDFDFGYEEYTGTTSSSGILALDSDIRFDSKMDVRIVRSGIGNDSIFKKVERFEFDNYSAGDYKYYVKTNDTGGQSIVTTEASAALTIVAQRKAPVLSDSIATNFPSALAIAKGALIYVREFEDKDADTSVEDAKFIQILQEVVGAEQRSNNPKRAVTRAELNGHYTGEVT